MATDWDEDTSTDISGIDAASPLTRNRACLTVLTGSCAGDMFRLKVGETMIGRGTEADVRLLDDGVSRNHAVLRFDGRELWIDDLGSRNGTYVNGVRISAATLLADGDKLQIGRGTVARFAYHDQLDDSFHEQLLGSALRDPLTKLFNRRYLLDRLDGELKFARRHNAPLSLLMLDLDHFKLINDTHGHLAGDAVLTNVADVVQGAVRDEDVVARFGGEELAIILRASHVDAGILLGERLVRAVEQTTTVISATVALKVTVSIGIAGYPAFDAVTTAELLEAADQALYRAKHGGRNRISR